MSKDNNSIPLSEIERGKSYTITGFDYDGDIQYIDQLQRNGFSNGTVVKKGVSSFSDPFSIVFRGGRISLRKKEANCVFVKELEEK